MNTAQAHWNEEVMAGSPMGDGRLVFGLITASMTVGLTSQDTSENALAELGLDKMRFRRPVHHGDTITAYSEVLSVADAADHEDAGVVRFKHWGRNQGGDVVCELERIVLVKRRSHWVDTGPESVTVFDESGNHETAHEHAAPMISERSGPLIDVRVVDLTQALGRSVLHDDLGRYGSRRHQGRSRRGATAFVSSAHTPRSTISITLVATLPATTATNGALFSISRPAAGQAGSAAPRRHRPMCSLRTIEPG